MRTDIRLTPQDVEVRQENALDLYYSGIKAAETKQTMTRNLKTFLVDACADLLQGSLEQRAQQFVDLTRDDQQKTTHIILAYLARLRERTLLEKSNPSYLNPSSVPNRIKPIKKLLEMNNLGLGWKRIYSTYPAIDNTNQGRGYTREEIKKLLEYSDGIDTDFIILASSSGGLRVGAWNDVRWSDVFPIYRVNEEYKIDLSQNESGRIVCAAMRVYRGTTEEYTALVSIEAWQKLEEYKKIWITKMKREPTDSEPLILERFSKPIGITSIAVKMRIEELLVSSGIRTPLLEGKRRHTVPATHGFRRYWNKVMMNSQRKRGTLSALVIKERLMGHGGLVKTDKNYFWADVLDLVPDYLEAMYDLMINDEERLVQKLEDEKAKSNKLSKANLEKDFALERMHELEAKVQRILKYQKI
ncbi:MAG: hypothetical protein WBF38_01380 [Nitrosotalea sp.]